MPFQSFFLPTGRPNEVDLNWDAIGLGDEKSKRKLRPDLTPEELERLQKYGAVHFESAGATRKR